MKNKFIFDIDLNSDIPKYQQLVNAINDALANNTMLVGDMLPSVNSICKDYKLSRDTVFKSYTILKDQKVIDSVPNKGYYVANVTRKVLLVLDTFKAYKEVLYHAFINNLPDNVITDVQFHHYNIENFKTILNNSKGKYYKYVVMGFNNEEVPKVLDGFRNEKLLLIDWNIHSKKDNNFVCQDFGDSFFEALQGANTLFEKYKEIYFVFPEYTYHPVEAIAHFEKYCKTLQFKYKVINIKSLKHFKIEKNIAYISVSDRFLGKFLEECRNNDLEPGIDVGFLSYNETPMKKFIYKGISVVSTDFKALGEKAAEFIYKNEPLQVFIPTNLTLRESL
ncbi:GntR family transcriptional regulator [Flavivirga eckloniae]|uniref:GntR family transcriptional regulator n=1 Tax=Flavivirga eckloniae TaxID=1803846 RepID=A0A2K9PTV5_9FLAO|nr:GntR family transcriptional regulator [Flavivirga eckloniae]AUP80479.1 GntR family transcriptional regulator [Flavivirga eckloniae]